MTKNLLKTITLLCLGGIFVAFFPWIFSFQGQVLGQRISIRSLGDSLGILLVILGLFALIRPHFRRGLDDFAKNLDGLPKPFQDRIMGIALLIHLMGIISHKLRAHFMLSTHAFDLGFFSNICWNTANGNWFFSSDLERNFMSVHVNWILWPLSFFYRFFPTSAVLLVAQAVFMCSAVFIFWILAQKITGRFSAGGLASLLLACSPYFNHSISNDFHPDTWLLPCLMAALWAWKSNKPVMLLLFALGSLAAKEDLSVVLCGFGLLLIFQQKWRVAGASLIVLSLAVFLFHTQYFIPHFIEGSSESLLFTRYPLLGSNFEEIVRGLFLEPTRLLRALAYEPSKYWRFFCYFFPTAGLTFLSPLFLIPPVISVMPHLLSQASTQLSLADIYSLPSQPFIFVGAVLGAQRLVVWRGGKIIPFIISILLVVAGLGILNSPRFFRNQARARTEAFSEIKRLIPDQASLVAQQSLHPHFECRANIQLFPIGFSMPSLQKRYMTNPEFILADRIGNALPYDGFFLTAAIQELENNPDYEKIFERENFLLFKRRVDENLRWQGT
ncbi:MAG: hypothetical protein KCHDKBKB_01875 [Elusimicrobia bacterium]|nr:hypothetical protein [Elusimicrobiota bacterium]